MCSGRSRYSVLSNSKHTINTNMRNSHSVPLNSLRHPHNTTGNVRINVTRKQVRVTTVAMEKQYVLHIWCSGDDAQWYILIIKPTRCTNFSYVFWNKTLHISDSSSVRHQAFYTVHTAMVYVIQVLLPNLYEIYHCCVCSVERLMRDRGTVRNT